MRSPSARASLAASELGLVAYVRIDVHDDGGTLLESRITRRPTPLSKGFTPSKDTPVAAPSFAEVTRNRSRFGLKDDELKVLDQQTNDPLHNGDICGTLGHHRDSGNHSPT
jgi:hypothetical protein